MKNGTDKSRVVQVALVSLVLLVLVGCASDPQLGPDVGVSTDGLVLGFGIDTCNADITYTVEETPTEVVVTPEALNDDRGSDCRDSFTVTLAEPLGNGTLIDGRNDVLSPVPDG